MSRVNVGDVFLVPTADGRAGVGQVVARYGRDAYFYAIFDRVLRLEDAAAEAEGALSTPAVLVALSLDSRIRGGQWKVVGNAKVSPHIPLPAFKEAVGSADSIEVVDYSGERRRKASAAEEEALPFRKIVAPIRLERAFLARIGEQPWVSAFDELKAHRWPTTSEVFDGVSVG